MKYILLFLFPSIAIAAPFLYSDPEATGNAVACVYTSGGSTQPISTPLVDGGCKIDVKDAAVGTTNIQVWFVDLWGGESEKIPFDLKRPVAGGIGPVGLRLGN